MWNDFDAYSPILADAQQRVAAFIRGDGPTALVLAGNVGCGKTHLARVVCKFYSQVDCRLLSEPDLIAHIQAGYNGEGETEDRILARLRCAKMLVLDDVGTAHVREQSQGWLEGIYWRILDRRAERQLPTLLTTNLDMAALRLRIGTRAMSRLMGMMQDQAGFVGMFGVPDYRTRGWR